MLCAPKWQSRTGKASWYFRSMVSVGQVHLWDLAIIVLNKLRQLLHDWIVYTFVIAISALLFYLSIYSLSIMFSSEFDSQFIQLCVVRFLHFSLRLRQICCINFRDRVVTGLCNSDFWRLWNSSGFPYKCLFGWLDHSCSWKVASIVCRHIHWFCSQYSDYL